MGNNFSVDFDFETIMKIAIDKALVETISSLMPDEKTKKMLLDILSIHRKYGIDAPTSIKILQDLAELMKEENNAK